VPRVRANEILLTGRPFGAQDAAAWGVINRVTPDGEALTVALALAADIAGNAPLAVRHTLAIANAAHAANDAAHWPQNDRVIGEIGQTADAAEGARAFIEKRAPVWQGK
jgi:enoyl-CoA hydratase/carnithine racemase